MRTTHYLGGWLLLILITGSNMGWGQSSSGQLNDLAFVLQRASSRTLVEDSLNALATRHGLQVWLTTLDESSPFYSKEVQQQAAHLLQQATPALVITTWHELDPKALQRTEVQVNSTMAERLPLATAEQIIAQALAVYATNPLPEEVLREGMLLALHRLDTYLNALPPVGEVPTITFTNPAATTASPALGLDQLRYSAHQGNYEQLEINEAAYPVAWKALASGTPTTVLAQVDEETSFPPGVVFRQNENSVPSQPGSESHQQQLTLTGQAHQQEGSLEVYAGGDEDAELVGKLNTISYDALYQKLVLVPLNRDIRRGELLPLVDKVATIYQQAAVNLEVDVSEPLMMADWSWNHALEDGTTGLLANYTREMRQVIRTFRQEQDTEKETAYVFLCYQSKSGNKQGYMPKKRQYGFVFDSIHHNDQELAATIAHELGHGLFRLEHTFETYPTLRKGSTDNLMDYGTGTRLHKYQWDFVHNPKAMLGWFQDDEENALDACFWAKSLLKYNEVFGQKHPLEADLPRYEEVRDNFDTYWQQSKALFAQHRFGNNKQNNLALKADAAWTIRNASHYQKEDATFFVDLAIKRLVSQQPRVQLHPEGITLAKVTLEGVPFRVALHSTDEYVDPDYIRVEELCELVDTKKVQVLIEDGQLLIAYLKEGQAELVLQVLSDDWDHGVLWLKYLGIYVAKDSEANWLATIPKFWEDWTWGGEEADEVVDMTHAFFVSDDDAWYRQKEAPYKAIRPVPITNILKKGLQVSVLETVKDSKDRDVAKIKIESSDSIAYTSLSNLSEVKTMSREVTYKMIKDYTAVKRPYSSESIGKTYKKDTEFTAYKRCGDYVKVKEEGGSVEGHWISNYALKAKNAELLFTSKEFKESYPNVDELVLKDIFTFIDQYRFDYGIDDCEELIHFLAQADHESGGFYYTIEQETFSGDRETYKGRGIFQLTFKSNYISFQEHLETKGISVDLVSNPEILEQTQFAVLSALWYWQKRKLSKYATKLQEGNLLKISKLVNCGNLSYCGKTTDKDGNKVKCETCLPNGWDDRKRKFKLYKDEIICK